MAGSIAGATLSVTQTITLWTVFLPDITEIKEASDRTTFADEVRFAECMAISVSAGIALIVCRFERSWEPLVAWAAISVLMFAAYEYSMRSSAVALPHLTVVPNHA